MSQTKSILISGSSGLLGSALTTFFKHRGHSVTRLVRSKTSEPYTIQWNPLKGFTSKSPNLENFDVVVHLAGENIAGGRWTSKFKKKLHDSRVESTKILSDVLAKSTRKPELFICASAIGFYGHRGDEELNETSAGGSGFLAEMSQGWEAAAQSAKDAGIRVVHLRTGIVLSSKGGALKKMLPAFRWNLGGPLGNGMQFMSWIDINDWVSAVAHIMRSEELLGPINIVSPNPVTNNEFTKALAQVLGKRVGPAMPAFMLRLLIGEMADEAVLASSKVYPKKLEQSEFKFAFPELEPSLRHVLRPANQ